MSMIIFFLLFASIMAIAITCIKLSKDSDEGMRNEKLYHEIWRKNQKSKGLVLDEEAYKDGTEKYILPTATPQYPMGIKPNLIRKVGDFQIQLADWLEKIGVR